MTSETSGWYARLDHECPDREIQIETWLESWLSATKNNQPIAAALPQGWPTLPAGLLSNPGTVLDHLLARLDAERDGRSPRGSMRLRQNSLMQFCTMNYDMERIGRKEPPATLSLAALPPSFRAFAKQINKDISDDGSDGESRDIEKNQTNSGIPLPFADPCVGGGGGGGYLRNEF